MFPYIRLNVLTDTIITVWYSNCLYSTIVTNADLIPVYNVAADREVQRILLELLNQMDGFDQTVNVKVHKYLDFILFLPIQLKIF